MCYQEDIQVSSEVSLVPFTAKCVDSIRRLNQHGYVVTQCGSEIRTD